MAIIKPFCAVRYTMPIDTVVAPPYDVISPEDRQKLGQSNAYNIVHLTLPEGKSDDRSQYVKYAQAAARLTEWRREQQLVPDQKPGYYLYRQTFTDPVTGQKHKRSAIIGLLRSEPYETGTVMPHEQTFPGHKEDRLRLLEATRTHLECIYGMYDDANGKIKQTLENATFEPLCSTETPDGIYHELYVCDDEQTNVEIEGLFADKRILIADGHHRYETILNFRKQYVQATGTVPEDFLPVAFTALQDPGLIVLPTHRMVKSMPPEVMANFPAKLEEYFQVDEVKVEELPEMVRKAASNGARVVGIVLPNKGYLCTLRDIDIMDKVVEEEHSMVWKRLDVTVLHTLMMEKLLGLPKGVEAYTRDDNEVLDKVGSGEFAAGFMINAPTVDETREIASSGEKMPQKSTFFYPKLLSGLVMWSFGDGIG
ncbi:MAG: DUF1015 domain-containing protein [bacterium]